MTIGTLKAKLIQAKELIQKLSPSHPILESINSELCSYHGVSIRHAPVEDRLFAVELPSGFEVLTSDDPAKCCSSLHSIIWAQKSAAESDIKSVKEFNYVTGFNSDSSPTQHKFDQIPIRQFSPRGKEIKAPNLGGLDLNELEF